MTRTETIVEAIKKSRNKEEFVDWYVNYPEFQGTHRNSGGRCPYYVSYTEDQKRSAAENAWRNLK